MSGRSIHTMDFTMDEARYVELLRALCSESEGVQNSPALGLIPREDNISRHVFEYLKEHTQENGGRSSGPSGSIKGVVHRSADR